MQPVNNTYDLWADNGGGIRYRNNTGTAVPDAKVLIDGAAYPGAIGQPPYTWVIRTAV
jgi:hypothetical protein